MPGHAFQPLDHPVVFDQPRRLTDVTSWHEHLAFAFFAVAALRPRLVVELGTWKGDSYCAFCQAVQTLGLGTSCYAVDTWKGDAHTGDYGPEALAELRAHHDPLYGSFSVLLQQTFDEAAERFADGSVDLLHVDGCHTYEAVAHDVERWLPKLGERGVLLLHDTRVREGDFGVWRFWEEITARYAGYAFVHGHGLGVLAVGEQVDPAFVKFLQSARDDPLAGRFFAALGSRIAAERDRDAAHAEAAAQVHAAEAAAERQRREAEEALAAAAQRESQSRVELGRMERQLRAREADLAGVVASPSWRVTAPLRVAKREVRKARRFVSRIRRRRQRPRDARDGATPAARPLPPASTLSHRPLVSVVTPVYDTDPEWLGRAVESVRRQTYPHWQLCLADDGSTDPRTLAFLESLASDPAIEVLRGDANRGIAAATNMALTAALGELVAFLDHDDELHPDALLACVGRLNEQPETDVIYTDEDKVDLRGAYTEPFFKPDWSPELLRGVMYVGHLLVVRRSLVERVGGLDSSYDGVQDFELVLRLSEHTDRIEHVPRILYHWRKLPGSIARSTDAKDGISELQAAAVNAHLARAGIAAFARPHPAFPHRAMLHPKPRAHWPRVTVIIPTKDAPRHLGRCLESIFACSTYPNLGVLLVDNGTTDAEALGLFERYPVDVLPFDERFSFSRANNLGVERADGELVVFLNNDTEVRTPEWLEELVSLAERHSVGAVGPLLLYPNGTVQHAGVVLGMRGTADHIMRGFPGDDDGYAGSLSCTREISAVTGACMLVHRGVLAEVGGFDEHFATHYQDVDLCLRIRGSGRRILCTPRAVLVHHESVTRGGLYDHVDRALFLDRWGDTVARGDPYYNPVLSRSGADYRPAVAA